MLKQKQDNRHSKLMVDTTMSVVLLVRTYLFDQQIVGTVLQYHLVSCILSCSL